MTTQKRQAKEKQSKVESNAAKRWWGSLSQEQRDFAMRRFLGDELHQHLRGAISLAETYLDDGAPYSALRVLRKASSEDVVMRLGLGIKEQSARPRDKTASQFSSLFSAAED